MAWPDTSPSAQIIGVWLLLAIVVLIATVPKMDRLGLYYDEAFIAQQARDFVEPERAGTHAGSVRSTWLFGRPFPLRNAAYMGSLKSQLLIPVLAVFGTSPRVVRSASLMTGLIGLLLAMLATGRLFGRDTAMLGGALAVADPSFFFLSQFEWGPFTTNLLCRSAGALLLVVSWQSTSPRRALAAAVGGGVALGLGVFSRADFVVILVAGAAALLLARPRLVGEALRERRRLVLASLAALLLAASPMILSAPDLLASSSAAAERGGIGVRISVLASVLDGSQFHRLMQTGGRFAEAPNVAAPAATFPFAVAIFAGILLARLITRRSAGMANSADATIGALLLAAALLTVGMLAMPGAVRAHHQLNTFPLLHLVVASGALSAWRWPLPARPRTALRSGVVVLLLLTLLSQLRVIVLTQELINETGGKGRWTRALNDLAREIDNEQTRVISLDWGFHEPLQLLTERAELLEAIWVIPQFMRRGKPWIIEGDVHTVYLAHDAPYDLFGLGPLFLAQMRLEDAASVEIRAHRDGSGEVAFYSVRVARPHRLVYTGEFHLQ